MAWPTEAGSLYAGRKTAAVALAPLPRRSRSRHSPGFIPPLPANVPVADVFSTPVDNIRQMLANCPTFQDCLGVSTVAAALLSIAPHGTKNSMKRPGAFVMLDEAEEINIAGGSQDWFAPRGTVCLVIELPIRIAGTATTVYSLQQICDSSLIGKLDYFTGQAFRFTSGAALPVVTGGPSNPVVQSPIFVTSFNTANGALTLSAPLPAMPAPGDAYQFYAENPEQAYVQILNRLGMFLRGEMLAQSGRGGNISIRKLTLKQYGRARGDEDQADYVGFELTIQWGI